MTAGSDGPGVGLTVTHRRYVSDSSAHYAGDLVDGAFVLALFGDAATEMCIRTDGDEGLFASYSDVQFVGAVRAGDVVETEATLTRVGRRSRELALVARVLCRRLPSTSPDSSPGAAQVLPEPLVVTTAVGTVVVPARAD